MSHPLPPPLVIRLPDSADLDAALAGLLEELAVSPVAVMVTDAELDLPGPRIVFANAAMERLSGYSAAELIGQSPRLLQGPLTDRTVMDRLKAELQAGQPFAGGTVNYCKDRVPYPATWAVLPVTHLGRVVRYVSHQSEVADPTDPVQAALRARAKLSEERFELAVTACGLGFWDLDIPPGTVYLSPGWKQQLGYADADLPNSSDTFYALLHPDDRERVRAAVDRAAAGADPSFVEEFRLRHRTGRWVWVVSRGATVRDAAGRPVRLVGTHTDVTDRKAAEEAVRAGGERLRTLLESVRDVVLVVAPDGTRRYVSGAVRQLAGYDPAELVGRSIFDHVHPDDRAAVRAALADVVARPGAERRVEFRYRAADGRELHLEASGVDLSDVPAVGGVLVSARDITERRRLEEQVRQGHKLEALGLLASGVSHDFNNILTIILGGLDLLKPPADPADRAMLDQVRAAAGRARGLTDALLGFARRRDGVAPRPVAIGALLAATADILRRVLGKQVSVVTVVPADLPAVVCDPGAVEQAVLNLALNARDAMPGGGTLTVEAAAVVVGHPRPHPEARPGRFVAVSVTDTGTGMPAAVRARVFEPFFTTKPAGKGTGLGLPMVADTARRLGGWVTVDSAEGRGTRVELVLPAAAEPAPPPDTPPPAAGGRVLVIDDEELIRTLVAAVLGRAGYVVDEAEDGPAGVAAFRATRPDVVLLDLTLPGTPGEAVLRELLALDPAARVLVVSGLVPDEVPAGAAAVLAKPFTSDRLLAAVRAALVPGDGRGERGA